MLRIAVIAPTLDEAKSYARQIVMEMEDYAPCGYNGGGYQYEEYEYELFGKENIDKLEGSRFEQIILCDRHKLPRRCWDFAQCLLQDSCVPEDYRVIYLEV